MKLLDRHRIADAPRRTLAELPEGVVARVVGRARTLADVLEAPLSGRPCVYYQLTITKPVLMLNTTLAHEERAVLFTLDDGTARAIIDSHGCTADLVVDERDAAGTDHVPTGREFALLTRFGIEANEWMATGSRGGGPRVLVSREFVFREAIIGVGEEVAILGSAVHEPDPDAVPDDAYRGTQPTRLRMSSTPEHPLIISDHPSTTR